MLNAKSNNKIFIVLVLAVCAVALAACLISPVSSAKYVVSNDVTSNVTIFHNGDLITIDEREAIVELTKLYNNTESKMYNYWVTQNNVNKNGQTLDGLGVNFGVPIGDELKAAYADAHGGAILASFSFCIVNNTNSSPKAMTFYFVNADISLLTPGDTITVDKLVVDYTFDLSNASGPFTLTIPAATTDVTVTIGSKTVDGSTFNIILPA